jgi:hypothetical protein
MKKEEEKLERDFNELVDQFQRDIDDIKNQLRQRLYEPFERYVETSSFLRIQSKAVKEDLSSNQDFKNEFDEFLSNLERISKPGNNKKPYNIKKLLTEVFRIFNKGRCNNSTAASLTQANLTNTLINSGSSGLNSNSSSSSSSNSSSSKKQPITKSINELISELNENFENKPVYRNKGEANETYRHVLSESRKLYYKLLTILPAFMKKKETSLNLNNNVVVSNFSPMESSIGAFKKTQGILTDASNYLNNMDSSQYEQVKAERALGFNAGMIVEGNYF